MRSRRAARSARLVLAAAAVTALTATATACGPEDTAGSGTSTASSSGSAGGEGSANDSSSSGSDSNSVKGSGKADSGSDSGTEGGGDKKSGYGQACGTNDVSFTLTSKSQAGGYYQVTAKAKSGITCYLDVNTPSVSFGSGTEGVASPVGQGGEDPIKLTGSAVAYTGISPKTTDTDGGTEFESVIVALTEDDSNPAELKLPEPADVDKPIVTNWSTNSAETVPVIP
ncbi:hypothetical protein [Streptomyces sp. Je 1-369]|uniref:hypothetical protein n=1 Tax=Streptomyces sp. Je 1-369 TaxID=2966192 RepID=UPI00228590C7|nr:hypothetical protein [Streptomyces sp. Je 1-369]WAL93195.1 hypothetical protein NOO62_01000 [Streptomyces sp. Je 1-369]